ncbi:unnamed protein product (macronuclear) [Paramecium tetraurelia]|uniref:Uncharacterized protein n=1 Tax=Paramecium tetraurelia TaxID=5888 RepID=A0D6D8_PARTE|nr:uncharacterized protein GSPATT00001646001 [Paramecium tetraurelia]CAK78605.1 unnamed protein product [Paramecium tetraurelia]|eukprot:XP_001446002.1 hypothetical protein (macronuclear) [Paramecium tetraurelia strain d4-2]
MKSARCMEYLIDQFHLDDVIQYKEWNALISSNEDATIIVILQQHLLEHYEDVDGRIRLIFQQEFSQFKNTVFYGHQKLPTRLALNKKGDILLIEIQKTKFNLYYKKAQLQQWTLFYSNCMVLRMLDYTIYSPCMLKSFNSQFSCFLLQAQSIPTTIVLNIKNTPQTKKLIQSQIQATDCILNEENNLIVGRESNQLHIYKQKKLIPFQKINLPNGLLYAKFDQLNNLILLTKAHLEIYFQQLGYTYQKIAGIPIINNNQICNIVPIDAYIIIQRTYLGAEFAQVCQIEDGNIQIVGKIICRQIISSSNHTYYLVIKEKQIEIYRHN